MPSIEKSFLMEAVFETFLDSKPVSVRILSENGAFYDIALKEGNLEPLSLNDKHFFGRNAFEVKRGLHPVTLSNKGPIEVYIERFDFTVTFAWQESTPTSIGPLRIFDFHAPL